MSMQIAMDHHAAILIIKGRIVESSNRTLRSHVKKLMNSNAHVKAIDLTDVDYIDSYALGQIIFFCNSSEGGRGIVHILNRRHDEPSYIDRLIKVSNLKTVFSIVDSLDGFMPETPANGA
jgi:anti-anti-sigma factor